MQIKILGFENVNYTKSDGTKVSGANVSYADAQPITKERGDGFSCSREWVSSRALPDDLSLGMAEIDFGRGRDGRAFISSIRMVK